MSADRFPENCSPQEAAQLLTTLGDKTSGRAMRDPDNLPPPPPLMPGRMLTPMELQAMSMFAGGMLGMPMMGGVYFMPMPAMDPRMLAMRPQYPPPPMSMDPRSLRMEAPPPQPPPPQPAGRKRASPARPDTAVEPPRQVKRTATAAPSAAQLQDAVVQYLKAPKSYRQQVLVSHSIVAQRSYGHEKRYLCPPPCVLLRGARWKDDTGLGLLPRFRVTCDSNLFDAALTDDERFGMHAISKTVYVADHGAARTCSSTVTFDISLDPEYPLGSFASAPITVISKPVKKIRSDRPELCVKLRTPMALFNRVRGQTVSTRYLGVDDRSESGFHVTGSAWSSFDFIQPPAAEATPGQDKSPLLLHGQLVCLRDHLSGKISAPVILKKVEKNMVLLDAVEPVSQLMKIALCIPGADNHYLSLCDGVLSLSKAIPHPECATRAIIMEGATWTVSSTQTIEYTFADMRRPLHASPLQRDPQPIAHGAAPTACTAAAVSTRDGELMLEVRGETLSGLVLFVGATRLQDVAHAGEYALHAPIPQALIDAAAGAELPIILARADGVLFPTPFAFATALSEVVPLPLA